MSLKHEITIIRILTVALAIGFTIQIFLTLLMIRNIFFGDDWTACGLITDSPDVIIEYPQRGGITLEPLPNDSEY